ncbi:MAG: hypothetical protein ACO1N2_00960 [Candidatus Saccharimonadota bacterium]
MQPEEQNKAEEPRVGTIGGVTPEGGPKPSFPPATPPSQPSVNPNSIYPTPHQTPPLVPEPSPLIPDKSHKIRNTILFALAIVLICAGGYVAYRAFFDPSKASNTSSAGVVDEDKLTAIEEREVPVIDENTLVLTTEANSQFLTPQGWDKADGDDSFVKYQAKEADLNGYRSTLAVSYYPAPSGQTLANASDATLAQIRDSNIKQYTSASLAQTFASAGIQCGMDPTLNLEPDIAQSGTTIGVFYLDSVCPMDDDAIIKARLVYDRDGTRRMVMIFTSKSSSDQNGSAYDKILASIKKP